jgi:hypothetical protein
MENIEDFCVSHNYTGRDIFLLPLLFLLLHLNHPPTLLIPLYMFIHCFSELRYIIQK